MFVPLRIVLLATMDTKGRECAYLAARIRALCAPQHVELTLVDAGIRGMAVDICPDILPAEVASSAGHALSDVRRMVRGEAINVMCKGAAKIVLKLYQEGRCDGIVSLCGGSGASIAGAAMQALPVGVPKIMATPLASGPREFGFYIGTKDIMIMHSVVDISGVNSISRLIYDNLAGAIIGASTAYVDGKKRPSDSHKAIGITMIGNTTDGVEILKKELEQNGYEPTCFHSSGVGGPAMESLIAEGVFTGIIDYTTNEVFEDLIGGIQRGAGPQRMTVAGAYGLPQIIVPGCCDEFDLGPIDTIPEEVKNSRKLFKHSPVYTLCQLTNGELSTLGGIFAQKLNPAKGPVKVVIPMRGLSIPGCPGGVFDNTEGVACFARSLRENLRKDIEVIEVDAHINDPSFAKEVADLFMQMLQS